MAIIKDEGRRLKMDTTPKMIKDSINKKNELSEQIIEAANNLDEELFIALRREHSKLLHIINDSQEGVAIRCSAKVYDNGNFY
jgi:mevalonate kinase